MSDLKARYDKLLAAVEAIECGAQSYTIDGQSVTKANLDVGKPNPPRKRRKSLGGRFCR